MKLVKNDGSMRTVFCHRLDVRIPHIHGNSLYRRPLFPRQGSEKIFQRIAAPSPAHKEYSSRLPIDDYRQVAVLFLHRYLINGKQNGISNILFFIPVLESLLVNIFYRFPIKAEMIRNLPDRHHFAEFQDIPGQSSGHPQTGLHKAQVFDDNPAGAASNLPVTVAYHSPRIENIQIPDHPLVVGMNPVCFSLAYMTDRSIPLVGFYSYLYFFLGVVYHMITDFREGITVISIPRSCLPSFLAEAQG